MRTGPTIKLKIMSRGHNKAPVHQKNMEVKMARKRSSQNSETEVAQKESLKVDSIDSDVEQNRAVFYPTEFSNILEPSRTSPVQKDAIPE